MLSANVLVQTANKLKFLLNDNSTVILTGVGVAGTIGTAVLTGRATFKAAKLITENDQSQIIDRVLELPENERGSQALGELINESPLNAMSKTEMVKMTWPLYIPPVVLGGVTVASIVLAHRISSKQIAGLVVASTVSERAFQEYKEKIVEKLGDKQSNAIKEEIAQDHVTNNPASNQVIIAGSGDVLCYEDLTGRYFNSTIETVKAAENKVNYNIIQDDYCSLSFFFDEIGLRPTTYSDMVGWNVNTRMEVTFTTAMSEDNRPCLVIGFTHAPEVDYDKLWAVDR